MKRYKTADEFIEGQEMWRDELIELRKILLQTDLKEEIKWGIPVYTLKGKHIVGISAFKKYFGLWFYQGTFLKDDFNKLVNAQEGVTKAMRQWRMNAPEEIDPDLILTYVVEAIKNQLAGKELKPAKKKKLVLPLELDRALTKNPDLSAHFYELTPYKQREFAEYVGDAKREVTRQKRLEKVIPMILNGIGLNDKYK